MDPDPAPFRISLFILLLPICIFLASCSESSYTKIAEKGVLDLRDWDPEAKPILELGGEWSYFPGKLLGETENLEAKEFRRPLETWAGDGYAVLKLKILLPEKRKKIALYSKCQATAFEIFINGKSLGKSGVVGKSKEESIPDGIPVYFEWEEASSQIELAVNVSNFHHRLGGLWYNIEFGDAVSLSERVRRFRDWDFFLAGIFLLAGAYHLGLFFLRPSDRTPLIFALFCLDLFLRLFVTEDKLLLSYFSLGYRVGMVLEYLTLYAAMPFALHFLRHTFPKYFSRKWMLLFYISSLAFCLTTILPFPFPSYVIPYFQATYFVAVALASYVLFQAVRYKEPYSLSILFAIFALITAGFFDVLSAQLVIATRFVIPSGLLVAIFTQMFILSFKYRDLYREKENLSERLKRLNETYSRFVPLSFLEFLGKEKLEDMRPGDQIRKEMTILFADIRSFTEISESLDSKESFELLNSYIREMEPIIGSHKGFVDKYFGDAIMALFAGAEDAVSAAVAMQNRILEYNKTRIEKGDRAIRVGIGIHTGSLMMGLVGSGERMESTVISEAVHLASKLEALNKYYGSNILISEDSFDELKDSSRFVVRKLDRLKFKGKAEDLYIYEIGDFLSETEKDAFRKSKTNFERGVDLFHSARYLDSGEAFREALRIYPGDRAANSYLKRCTEQVSAMGRVHSGPDLA
ncbi:adenylate/guanylate cyclase domain-containing protein [Leptospira wolffii]|uniref:adenylate/guanylate cyclase domain-containing protein n=1 Tax=Leptospira wolffii TaxID=409998 RepID=UPI001084568C|nr:adenylate/guanylate cyclase domain-containing protein [Leptospira wolffii]TGL45399.1 adenylate/guanylate cyclase domain-containing protein [Leptospira wolffii]